MPYLDSQCSDEVTACFRSFGMNVLFEVDVTGVDLGRPGPHVEMARAGAIDPEKIIFAAGRIGIGGPRSGSRGVDTDDRGRIVVDDHFQTTASGVYAAGDVIGPPALASASMEQGRVAACYSLGSPSRRRSIP